MIHFHQIQRPPRSTLFPSRRSSDLSSHHTAASISSPELRALIRSARSCCRRAWSTFSVKSVGNTSNGNAVVHARRSEEHTSELQSQSKLVCRLLLEKK